jgi:hypothetical protein
MQFHERNIPTGVPETAYIKLSGSINEVVSIMAELAWIAAVFRPSSGKELKLSSTKFKKNEIHNSINHFT